MFGNATKFDRQATFTDLNDEIAPNNRNYDRNASFSGNPNTTTNEYVVSEDLYVEVEPEVEDNKPIDMFPISSNDPKMKYRLNDAYLKNDSGKDLLSGSIVGGSFAELRANLQDIDEELHLALEKGIDDEKNLYKFITTKKQKVQDLKKRNEIMYVEVDAEENTKPISFGKYMGQGIPLSPEIEYQLIGLMKKAGKYRLAIDKLESRLKDEVNEKKKVKSELVATAKELEVAKLVATNAGSTDWRKVKTGSNINSKAQAEEARRKREEERRKLFSGLADDDEDAFFFGEDQNMNYLKRLIVLAKRWWVRNQPFGNDLRMVEARYGNSVASYFIFFRWLFVNAIMIAIVQSLFLTFHVFTLYTDGRPIYGNGTSNVTYTKKISWMSFTGSVPTWSLYSSYSPNEAIQYAVVLLISQLLLLLVTIQKSVSEDRSKKLFDQVTGNSKVWSKLTLNAFDHSQTNAEMFEDSQFHIGEALVVKILEERAVGELETMTNKEKWILFGRRIILFLAYVLVQGIGWYAIIYLTANNKYIQSQVSVVVGTTVPLDVVPIAVSVINAILPAVITKITKLEKWQHQGDFIKQKTCKFFSFYATHAKSY